MSLVAQTIPIDPITRNGKRCHVYRFRVDPNRDRTSVQFGQRWGYSSVAEHSTADREVTGSTPVAPCHFFPNYFESF